MMELYLSHTVRAMQRNTLLFINLGLQSLRSLGLKVEVSLHRYVKEGFNVESGAVEHIRPSMHAYLDPKSSSKKLPKILQLVGLVCMCTWPQNLPVKIHLKYCNW